MKKALAAVLALVMLMSCLVFPTMATEATVGDEEIVFISDCDTTQYLTTAIDDWASADSKVENGGWWTTTITQHKTDTVNPAQGTGSLAATLTGGKKYGSGATKFVYYNTDKTTNISNMKTLCFDLYVSDGAVFTPMTVEFELRSKGGNDSNERSFKSTLKDLYGGKELKDGWNHFEIPLTKFTTAPGKYDPTQWCYVRMFMPNSPGVVIGEEGTDYVVKYDNWYFTSRFAGSVIDISRDEVSGKIACTDATGSFVWEHTLSTPINVQSMHALNFAIKVDHQNLKDQHFTILISSDGGKTVYLDKLASVWTLVGGKVIPADGNFYPVTLPLSGFNAVGKAVDLTKINYIKIYSETKGSNTEKYGFTMKDLYFSGLVGEGTVLLDAFETSTVNDTTSDGDAAKATAAKMADLGTDNDTDKELVLIDVTGAGSIARQGGWVSGNGNDKPSIKAGWYLPTTPGKGNWTAVQFDLYVGQDVLLDKQFEFELRSASTPDIFERMTRQVLKTLCPDLKVGEWTTVTLPLSLFGNSSNKGDFISGSFNAMRIMADSNFDYTDGLTMAIDNLSVVYPEPETYEDTLGVGMPGNPELVLVDLNAGNSYKQAKYVNRFYNTGNGFTTAIDISAMDRMYADLYLENYDLYDDEEFFLEFSSSGGPDNQEWSGAKTLADMYKRVDGEALQNGWNRVYVDITAAGGFKENKGADATKPTYGSWNPTKLCHIRVWNNRRDIVGTEATIAKLANIRFATENLMDAPNQKKVSFKSASLRLDQTLDILYTANVHETMTDVSMCFEIARADGTTTVKHVQGTPVKGEVNQMLFVCEDMLPQHMTDTVTATLIARAYDGTLSWVQYGNYSIKTYCTNWLGKAESSAELKTLLCNVLKYGAASQVYANYGVDNLATAGVDLTAAKAPVTPTEYTVLEGAQGECPAKYEAVTVVLDSTPAIRVRFTADDVSSLTLNCFASSDVDTIITPEIVAYEDTTDVTNDYIALIPIRPYAMDTKYTFYFSNGETDYTDYALNYSMGTYIVRKQSGPVSPNLQNLLNEITAYSSAALDYVSSLK